MLFYSKSGSLLVSHNRIYVVIQGFELLTQGQSITEAFQLLERKFCSYSYNITTRKIKEVYNRFKN